MGTENTGSGGFADTLDAIAKGVEAIAGESKKQTTQGSNSAAVQEQQEERAKRQADEQAEAKTEAAEKQYKEQLAELAQKAKSYREQYKDLAAKAADMDAEKVAAQATEQQGIVSIGDALKAIDAEKEAKQLARKAAVQAFSTSAEYFRTQLVSGTERLLGTVKNATGGFNDGATEGSGLGDVAAIVAGSVVGLVTGSQDIADVVDAGVGAVTGNGDVTDVVAAAVDGFNVLNAADLGDGVDPKTVDGLEDPEAYAAYIAENAGGEGTDPYMDQNGQDGIYQGPDRTPVQSTYTEAPQGQRDALSATPEELAAMSSLDGLDVDGNVDLDELIAMNDKKYDPDAQQQPDGTLTGAVVDGQPGQQPPDGQPVHTDLLEQALRMADDLDNQQPDPNGGPSPYYI